MTIAPVVTEIEPVRVVVEVEVDETVIVDALARLES